MAIILETDSETGETLVYRTSQRKNRDTGGTETVKELLGGLYPFAAGEDMNGADFKDKTLFQKLVYDNGIYRKLMDNYERMDNLQKKIIEEQKKDISALQSKVEDLTRRLKKYE